MADVVGSRCVEVTWPYLAQEVEESLDPHLIEHHGRQILARAAVHGRLVAFLGAGVSMAYGRLSWADLVFSVLQAVADIDLTRYASDTETRTKIGARRKTLSQALGLLKDTGSRFEVVRQKAQALSGDRPLLVLHLCEDALKLAHDADCRLGVAQPDCTQTLADVFKAQLRSPEAHDRKWVDGLADIAHAPSEEKGLLLRLLNQHAAWALPDDAQTVQSRRYFLRAVAAAAAGTQETVRTKSQHDNGPGLPIALLLHDLRVQRYATTNYDHEIETALATGLRVGTLPGTSDEASPGALRHRSLVLGLDTAAAGLVFAIEGRRRHAEVLHLHGHIDTPTTVIASERHYQHQYLRPSPRHDLIDNTIRSLFGANPVVYVGSGISEEDVLRPLREFMSRTPRRNDTLGVALLPANKDAHGLALQKIECLVRFGIHVIHYGRDVDAADLDNPLSPPGPAWLEGFSKVVRLLKLRLEALAEPNQGSQPLPDRLQPLEAVPEVPKPPGRGMDGQPASAALQGDFAIDLELQSLGALVAAWGTHTASIAPATRDLLASCCRTARIHSVAWTPRSSTAPAWACRGWKRRRTRYAPPC